MRIKKGDKVIVISGKDRGKTGAVLEAFPRENRVIVEGVNLQKRHERSRRAGQRGQVIQKTMPIHVSNVMLTDPKTGKPTRIRISRESGKRIRVSVKSETAIA